MPHFLKNKDLEVRIDLPGEQYNHSRFDWTGKIVAVKFKEKYVSGTEMHNASKEELCGRGFYNEFGIGMALGYEATRQGDWFHKIGIGMLKKGEANYNFQKHYEIRPAEFEVETATDNMLIRCNSEEHNGYAYFLEKEIKLLESGFELKYHLKNRGNKAIITDEYNHNFLTIDENLIGEEYVLKFPFIVKPALFNEKVNSEQVVSFGANELRFNATPNEQFFFSNMSGGVTVPAKWILENKKSKIGISETGDFQTNKINLWGWKHVVSPELFFHINLQPGESIEWLRTYTIYEME